MIRKMVCLATLGVLLITPAADARKPRPKPDNVFAGTSDQGVPGYVKLLPRGRGIEVVFSYVAQCSDGEAGLLWRGVSGLPVRRGRFHYSHAQDTANPDITIAGRLGRKYAFGTWRVSFTIPDGSGGTITCDSGLVHWRILKETFGGRSSDGYPVIAVIDKGGVGAIQLAAALRCQSGRTLFWATPYTGFPTSSSGAFGDSFEDSGPGPENTQLNVTIEVRGRVGRVRTKGTWRITAVVLDATGAQVDSCETGRLTWSVAP